jgi:hypothetical protein
MALGGSGPSRTVIEEEQLHPDALISSMVLPLTIPRRAPTIPPLLFSLAHSWSPETLLPPPASPHGFQSICNTVLGVLHALACPTSN